MREFLLLFFAGPLVMAAGLHLLKQAGLIEVNSFGDELLGLVIEEVVRGYVHPDGVPARRDPHVFAKMGAGQHTLAHGAAGEVVLRFDFDVQVREGLADSIVESPHTADAFENGSDQEHVAKGGSSLRESGAGGVPVVRVFRRNVGGNNSVLTFGLLFESHGWGPYSTLTSSIAPYLSLFQYFAVSGSGSV